MHFVKVTLQAHIHRKTDDIPLHCSDLTTSNEKDKKEAFFVLTC